MNQANNPQPNVVVLFPDQLRALSLPMFGEQQIETPNIDRLAADSLVLENAISNCPVCTPARAMLLTGRYPQTTGHTNQYHPYSPFGNFYWRCLWACGI